MVSPTHSARITGPVPYTTSGGNTVNIPLGPCLVEQIDEDLVNIIWGKSGQKSAALPVEDIASAEDRGHLVLLD